MIIIFNVLGLGLILVCLILQSLFNAGFYFIHVFQISQNIYQPLNFEDEKLLEHTLNWILRIMKLFQILLDWD